MTTTIVIITLLTILAFNATVMTIKTVILSWRYERSVFKQKHLEAGYQLRFQYDIPGAIAVICWTIIFAFPF
jgi:hypothetical protein